MGRLEAVAIRLLATSVMLAAGSSVLAQDEATRPPVLVVEDLLGDDWKAARSARAELTRLGARAVPALLEARVQAKPTEQARGAIDAALRAIIGRIGEEIGRPLNESAVPTSARGAFGGLQGSFDPDGPDLSAPTLKALKELGDLGSVNASEPQTFAEKARRARLGRTAVLHFGPPITSLMLEVPPLRERALTNALTRLAWRIYVQERKAALAATTPAARAAFAQRYVQLTDLAAPIVAAGVRDPDKTVQAQFEAIRLSAVQAALAKLDDVVAGARVAAEDALFRLDGLALTEVKQVAAGKHPTLTSAQARSAATRLARRIKFRLSRTLIRKLGHELEGYAKTPFRARRALVFEIGRLGGADAIPTLRALLRVETSVQVQLAAAIGLVRQRDPSGADWFELQGSRLPKGGLTKRELSAIHMDQGLRHLTHDRFERAEREFKRVVDVDPKNEIAWYNLACTYSRWGKIKEAISHLEKAVEYGFDDTKHMAKDPDLDNIRKDPRYLKIIEAIKAKKDKAPEVPR